MAGGPPSRRLAVWVRCSRLHGGRSCIGGRGHSQRRSTFLIPEAFALPELTASALGRMGRRCPLPTKVSRAPSADRPSRIRTSRDRRHQVSTGPRIVDHIHADRPDPQPTGRTHVTPRSEVHHTCCICGATYRCDDDRGIRWRCGSWRVRPRERLVQLYPIAVQTSRWSAAGAGRASGREGAFLSGAQRRAGTGRGRPTTRRAKGPSVSSNSASRFRCRSPNRATSANGAKCSNSSARVLPRVASMPGTCLPSCL